MPELPEVETVRRDLAEWEGRTLEALRLLDRRVWFESKLPVTWFQKRKLQRVLRRGKYLHYDFGDGHLLQHLRMTGKMLPEDSPALPSQRRGNKQIRAAFDFSDAKGVLFFDTRRFGTLTAVEDISEFWQRKRQAPDPIAGDRELALDFFLERIAGRSRPIKAALLDQTIVAGVGNIYADEALHRTRIHPETLARALKPADLRALFDAIVLVFTEAIAKRGTTSSDYLDVNGNPGVFRKYLRVYRCTGSACKTCNNAQIERLKVGGRSSHFCPRCQVKQ